MNSRQLPGSSAPLRKICVLGLGYIGLPTAAVLATHGFSVVGVDVNTSVVDTVNNGDIHIEEPGLQTLVQAAYKSENLRAQSSPEAADVFIIAVPTPLRDKKADLTAVESAAESIVPVLKKENLVILESTVPPKTVEELVALILEQSGLEAGQDFHLAHCPERVLPGNILKELVENDRVIGGVTPESAQKAKELYTSFVSGRIYLTDATTAELVKLSENTFRDVNIALANELANVCENLEVDVWEVIELANHHPRVNFLKPGPGVGGHCISVDPWFIVETTPTVARLIRLSREINDGQPTRVSEKIQEMTLGINDPKVVVLGVSYKGNVDDIRESPALPLIQKLEEAGYRLEVVDPHVRSFPWELVSLEEAFSEADLAVVLTEHKEFQSLFPEELGKLMRTKQILDTRGFLDHGNWSDAGFLVVRLGSGKTEGFGRATKKSRDRAS